MAMDKKNFPTLLDESSAGSEASARVTLPDGFSMGYLPNARECALLLLLLIRTKGQETEKAVSRFRVSELTLLRMWCRRRIAPEFLEEVNDWLARADRVLFRAGDSYGVVLSSAVESWARVSSKRIQAEIDAVLAGTFDFVALEQQLSRQD